MKGRAFPFSANVARPATDDDCQFCGIDKQYPGWQPKLAGWATLPDPSPRPEGGTGYGRGVGPERYIATGF